MVTKLEMLENDYYSLSDSELEVLFIVDDRPILRTRLQKIALLYSKLYGKDDTHRDYLFGGFSDEVEESSDSLVDKGIILETSKGYVITKYGRKLKDLLVKGLEESEDLTVGIPNIKKAVSGLSDKSIIGLTYHFFEETTANSGIRGDVKRYNDESYYDGKKLDQMTKDAFMEKLMKGIEIRRGA